MLSDLDNALAAKAENALADYESVKKADVQLQTTLGNRKGAIAVNVVGAFADSQSSAFGWQVQAYSGESKSKGGNLGIFWRRIENEVLYGANLFGDYEKSKYGEFLRYGIGGEVQNAYVSFAANYYVPITNEKSVNNTLVAFSREGYDANLRINIPPLDFLKVAADYYHYDGKYSLAADNGFRYGLEVQPISDLRIGIFYDDGGEEFGGNIAYVYNISPPERESNFAPDLFSPILREYQQRIITAAIGPGTSLSIRIIGTATIRMTNAEVAMTTTGSVPVNTITSYATVHNIMLENRAANAQITTRVDLPGNSYVVFTSSVSILLTLPPAAQSRPWAITTMRNLRLDIVVFSAAVAISSNHFCCPVGESYSPPDGIQLYSLTVVQGSEALLDPGSMDMTITATTGTTRMTTFMDTLMSITTSPMMTITTFRPLFMTTIITLGLTTNAEVNVDSRLPSFPPLSPIMTKLAFAKKPLGISITSPPFVVVRRKWFAAKPPPLIL